MNFSALNGLDYLVLSIMLFSVLFALMRGFVASILSLIGWALSVYLTYKCYPLLEPHLLYKFNNPALVQPLGYSALLIGFLIFFAIFNAMISSAVGRIGFGALDRILGLAFGLLRGGLIVSFFFLCFSLFLGAMNGVDHNKEASYMPVWVTSSQTYPYLKSGKILILSTFNKDFHHKLDATYKNIGNTSVEERLMDYAAKRLETFVPQDKQQEIKKDTDRMALSKSEQEVDREKLRQMLDYYKHNSGKQRGIGLIPEEELKKLDQILNGNTKVSDGR
jgi:uncharacterized membrane protein required for colicin V production